MAFAASVLLVLAVAAACSSTSGVGSGDAAPPTTPSPTVAFLPGTETTGVALDGEPAVVVSRGRIVKVTLSSPAGPLKGQLAGNQRMWKATDTLLPSTTYSGRVSVEGDDGKHVDKPWTFTTAAPAQELHTSFVNVSDGGVYGVGMPIIVQLNAAIPPDEHQAFLQHLKVTTTPAVTGAWRWFSDNELHWRPQNYWPAGTKVSLDIDFKNFDVGNGVWGVDGRTVNFSIGSAHVSTVDAITHTMTVTDGGQVVKSFPVSTGRDQYPTKSGTHVVNEKAQKVIMDSATVGIPRDSPDGYYETVFWDVRISNSGEYVHAAPWSVADQGNSNVSHGCVNASTADAEWFYNFTQIGDVVQVNNTPDPLEPWNGYGDWQIPWAQWGN